jgi:Uri superfamily endonuclease
VHQKKAKQLKGIYVLIIRISQTTHPKIGALGELNFPPGLYAYVGSAQNNLELRVKRHQSKKKRLFWHIDYLLHHETAEIIDIFYKSGSKTEECQTASLLKKEGGMPIVGFGCSDCHCSSHIFNADNFDFLRKHMRKLKP